MINKTTFFLLTLFLSTLYASAASISQEAAIQKAVAFLSLKGQSATVKTLSVSGKAEMYLVTTAGGWCLMSSETGVKPVLAYSLDGEFPAIEDIPPGMKWLLSCYEDAIAYSRDHETGLHIYAWEDSNNQDNISSNNREAICLSRLGEIKWGQSGNNFGMGCDRIYNKFCPNFHSVSCDRTIAGCGAIALGQVLWYYQWPHWGLIPDEMLNDSGLVSASQSYKIYDWEMMPDKISLLTPTEEADRIASFLRDCGYAEHMQYLNNGSFTFEYNVRDALIDNFGYTTAEIAIRSYYPNDWINLMKNEIRNGRPIIYSGRQFGVPESGHFFILYGFDGNLFNINWGWKGNGNGLYSLDSLYVDSTTHFNDYQLAIINIAPTYPSCAPSSVPAIEVWGSNFVIEHSGAITLGNGTITSNMQGVILSDESVMLTSGFKVESGADVYIGIKDMHCYDDREEMPDSDNDETPGIFYAPQKQNSFDDTPSATKSLRDGHIYILRDDKTYTIQGLEVR